jgi:hypothetical protein
MLVGEQDVAIVAEDELRNARDYTFAVGTRYEEDGGIMHGLKAFLCDPCVLCGSGSF